MFPKMAGRRTQTLTIPELSGGINLRDGATLIQDNQLLDSLNMYYEGGLLKTRPPLNFLQNPNVSYLPNLHNFKVVNVEGSAVISGIEYAVKGFIAENKVYFYGISLTKEKQVKGLGALTSENYGHITNCVAFIFDGYIYCFCTSSKDGSEFYEIYKIDMLDRGHIGIDRISEKEIYAPLVLTNCVPNRKEDTEEPIENMLGAYGATQFEGYNFLSGYYKMEFTTVDDYLDEGIPTKQQYSLLHDVHCDGDFRGKTITAEITNIDGNTYTHEVKITGTKDVGFDWEIEEKKPGDLNDGLYMGVKGRRLSFFTDDRSGIHCTPKRSRSFR